MKPPIYKGQVTHLQSMTPCPITERVYKGSKLLGPRCILYSEPAWFHHRFHYNYYKLSSYISVSQICGLLGIVEKDYFGLQFQDDSSGYKIWINKRLRVCKQIKTPPPYVLYFCVKYYTQPQYLLQPSTM